MVQWHLVAIYAMRFDLVLNPVLCEYSLCDENFAERAGRSPIR